MNTNALAPNARLLTFIVYCFMFNVLLSAAAQSLIEVDDGLHLLELVGDERELGLQHALLSREGFDVGRLAAVAEEEVGTLIGSLHLFEIEAVAFGALDGGLVVAEGVGHFVARLEELLLEVELCGLLLQLRDFQVSAKFALRKDGLRETGNGREQHLARIDNHARIVGPTCRTAERELRIERAFSTKYAIVGVGQLQFGGAHIGTVLQELQGDAHLQALGESRTIQRAARNGVGSFVEEFAQGVLGSANVVAKRRQAVGHSGTVGFGLSHGSGGRGTRLEHNIHRAHVFVPKGEGAGGCSLLRIKHTERVVEVGHSSYDGGLRGLFASARHVERLLTLLLGIAKRAEEVDLPAGLNGQSVGFRCFAEVERRNGALRGESYLRQES